MQFMEDAFNDPGLIQEKGMRNTMTDPSTEQLQHKKPSMRTKFMSLFNKKRSSKSIGETPEESPRNEEQIDMPEEQEKQDELLLEDEVEKVDSQT